MQVIPVLDLKGGQAVHATAGRRADYRPVRSALCPDADPRACAAALLAVGAFTALYVADLDAIESGGQRRHDTALAQLCALLGERAGPDAQLWLDAGWSDAGHAPWREALARAARLAGVRVVDVVGSESLGPDTPLPRGDYVLSLDHRADTPLGGGAIGARAQDWPARVIAMELTTVGSKQGPAIDLLRRLRARADAQGRRDIAFYAAGGIRGPEDLATLQAEGYAGALVASALHNESLTNESLNAFK